MTIREKMQNGELYLPSDETILKEQYAKLEILYDFNATRPSELEKREEILHRLFAEIGEGCYIEPPLHANWGCHTHFGNHVYANFNLTLVDDTHIYVGDYTMFGPNVVVASAGHPILPSLREKAYQYNFPVRIGKNCWIGAGETAARHAVQHPDSYRKQRVDRRRKHHSARRHHRRQYGHRRRKRRDKGHSGRRRRRRKSVPDPEGNR